MLNLENSKFHIINTKTRMYGFIYMVSRRDEQQEWKTVTSTNIYCSMY